jgi:ubiquinone/menaquinone biosynthesis C-methylase UbiE
MTGPSFRDAELEGWDRKAGYWDDSLGLVTLGAIDPLMEAVEVGPGVRVLDIACGTGALAAAAARRGASIIGMDFAPTMIGEAIRRYPGIDFRVGDAEAIPLADASVDAVTCSFGMLHMERPERVLVEVARVLRPVTGRFALTSWTSDGEFFALVGQAVQAHADMGVPLPLARRCFALATKVSVVQPCSLRVSQNPVSKSYPSSGPVTHHRRSSTLSTGARYERPC